MRSISIGGAFKDDLFEKIENEYNLKLAEAAYKEYEESGKKAASLRAYGEGLIFEVSSKKDGTFYKRVQETWSVYTNDDQILDHQKSGPLR